MRPVNIVLLVLAGAIGGAVVMRVAQRPHPAPIAAVENSAPEPAVPSAAPAPSVPVPAIETPPSPPPAVGPRDEVTVGKTARATAPRPKRLTRAAIVPPKRVEFQPPIERHYAVPPAVAPSTPTSVPTVVAQVQVSPAAAPSTPPLTPEQPKETPPGNMEPKEVTPVPAPIPITPELHSVTLNAGMLIPVRLVDSLSLERNHAGDRFAATLDGELVADGFVIAERGARVEGKVVTADAAAKTLGIELTRVRTSDRQDVAIQTERFDKRNEPDRSQDVTKVGAGAVIGAVIGGIAGGGKGAAIGAGIGGGAGAGGVMLSRRPVALPSETRIAFRLRAPVTITERRD